MSKANSKTHKDMAVSRVPVQLAKRLEQDAKGAYTSTSHVIRRILLVHYGLMKNDQLGISTNSQRRTA